MTRKRSFSYLGFALLVTTLQTALSLLPGYLYFRDNSQGPMILPYMIVYLLLSDFFQVFGKASYKKGNSIPIPIYALKVIISGFLILMIIKQTTFLFVFIFIAYELFQLLIFLKQFFYIDSIFYSLTNALFKGVVFNQMLTISYPFNYDFKQIQPFIFSFFLILLLTILTQGMYSFLSKQTWFLILSFLCLIALYYLLYRQFKQGDLILWKFISFSASNMIALFFFAKSRNAQKKEVVLYLFGLVGMFVYYL